MHCFLRMLGDYYSFKLTFSFFIIDFNTNLNNFCFFFSFIFEILQY